MELDTVFKFPDIWVGRFHAFNPTGYWSDATIECTVVILACRIWSYLGSCDNIPPEELLEIFRIDNFQD